MGRLSADAQPFMPASKRSVSEEDRSLYMTFSNGSPLTWQEIFQHFTSEYGEECVEYVYVHKPKGGGADFGKIIFRRWETAKIVMKNEQLVRVLVNGKHLWLKKYVPPQQRRPNGNTNNN